MNNTDKLRQSIKTACAGYDVGITVAALGQVVRLIFENVDANRPDLSVHIRDDFNRHLTGVRKKVM